MKKLVISGFITSVYLSLGSIASAAPTGGVTAVQPCGGGLTSNGGASNPLCGIGLNDLLGPGITFAFVIAILVALGFLIWGGLKWILSQGDKNAVETAKQHIIASIVGLVIIFLSYLILTVALSFFKIDLFHLQLPTIGTAPAISP